MARSHVPDLSRREVLDVPLLFKERQVVCVARDDHVCCMVPACTCGGGRPVPSQ